MRSGEASRDGSRPESVACRLAATVVGGARSPNTARNILAPRVSFPFMRGTFLELAQSDEVACRFEAHALDALTERIGADAAFFAVKGAEPTPTVLGIDAESIARALRAGSRYELELLPIKRAALAARGAAVDTDVLGEAEVRRRRYFREIVSRLNGRHTLMAYLSWRGQVRGAIMLGRTHTPFSAVSIAEVEAVLPELGAARASYGWPFPERALPQSGESRWHERWIPRREVLDRVVTPEGELCVRDRNGFREMVLDDGARELTWTRAALARPSRSGWPYIELFHVAAAAAEERRRALFIGLGGGVAPRQFARNYPGIVIDVVERDPRVLSLAERWYDLAAIPGLTTHLADGAELVRSWRGPPWDVMIVDAYGAGFVEDFGRRSFFAAARRCLTPGGALALNLIGTLDGSGEIPDIVSAARPELGEPRLVPVHDGTAQFCPSALRNVVVIWTKQRR